MIIDGQDKYRIKVKGIAYPTQPSAGAVFIFQKDDEAAENPIEGEELEHVKVFEVGVLVSGSQPPASRKLKVLLFERDTKQSLGASTFIPILEPVEEGSTSQRQLKTGEIRYDMVRLATKGARGVSVTKVDIPTETLLVLATLDPPIPVTSDDADDPE